MTEGETTAIWLCSPLGSLLHWIGSLGVDRSQPCDTASKIWDTLEMTEPLRLLTDDEITDALIGLPGWRRIDDKLHAGFSFHNFVAAFEFMTGVAGVAEEFDHHPEWSNVYGSVTINLTNHDAGGITELDLAMAGRINTLAGRA